MEILMKSGSTAAKPFLIAESDDGWDVGQIVQGSLNDGWFLNALALLSNKPDELCKLFLSGEFSGRGMYVVQFYKDGLWQKVTVDDRIPCDKDTFIPIFSRNKRPEEIWVMILEKAYAKLHGCYEVSPLYTISYTLIHSHTITLLYNYCTPYSKL